MAIYQILVKHLDGTTVTLQFPTQTITGHLLKSQLQSKTGIPFHLHRLAAGSQNIHDQTVLTVAEGSNLFPSATLLLRLRGGKGGFGSLLRGAATKAGQKKTNNFDACRDMSGRRLRHVNAEKRLEEWKAGAEDRKLEKIAEQFLRKKAKEVKKKKDGVVEKYIEKYREDSERCMEEVEESVRQSFVLYEEKKRKVLPTSGLQAKRLKVWLGKKAIDASDSDSDEDDDDSDIEDDKSVVSDSGNQKDGEGSSESGCQTEGESLGGGCGHSSVEEGPNAFVEVGEGSGSKNSTDDSDGSAVSETRVHEEDAEKSLFISCFERSTGMDKDKERADILKIAVQEQTITQSTEYRPVEAIDSDEVVPMEGSSDPTCMNGGSSPEKCVASNKVNLEMKKIDLSVLSSYEEESIQNTEAASPKKSLNFDDFSSSAALEVLGMERLKTELQANGLKCGGTLQERAARLFLLKTTPVEKLPKKLLARPSGGK